jgi:DNA polymerase III delta subunit
MPPVAMRALKTALENGVFDRAYLFHGDDDYLKEEKVRAVIARATEPSTKDFNLEVRRGAEVDAAALGLSLDALPMMAERRVVIVRDVMLLKKDARATLDRYLERPAGDVVLVLVASGTTKPDLALVERSTAVEFRLLNEDELAKWVSHRVEELGTSITSRAAGLLCGATGNDLALLAGEIEKLRSFTDSEIDEAAVGAVVGVHRGETLGDLLDAVGQRDGVAAAALLARVLSQPKTTAVSIVMALTTQTLAIGWLIAARGFGGRGLQPQQVERNFYNLLGQNRSSVVGRPWNEAVKGWARAVHRWDDASIDRSLELLLTADASLKETRFSSEEQILTTLLLAISTGTSRRTVA